MARLADGSRWSSGGEEHAASGGIGATVGVTLAGIFGPWQTFAELEMAFGSIT
jgi:hypothetical protein